MLARVLHPFQLCRSYVDVFLPELGGIGLLRRVANNDAAIQAFIVRDFGDCVRCVHVEACCRAASPSLVAGAVLVQQNETSIRQNRTVTFSNHGAPASAGQAWLWALEDGYPKTEANYQVCGHPPTTTLCPVCSAV